MIQYKNRIDRNLEEQVLENQRLIAEHYEISRVLQNYGIIIVGTVSSAEELPDPLTYTGSYGDAYSVGAEPPYTFYVFTRPNQAIGETDNRWLDVGELAIPGPQGPAGEPGPIGETGSSTRWYSGSTNPAGAGFKNGDQWLNTSTGDVYQYNNNVWTITGNVKGVPGDTGPRGPIGPQGNPGPAGPVGPAGTPSPIIDVLGELENIDQLPSPSAQPANAGYLIPIGGINHLFIIMSGQWADSGTWGGGSTITVGGEVVSNFDADTKLDKMPPQQYLKAYCVGNAGTEMIGVGTSANQLARRTTGGHITVPTTGFNNQTYAVPKKYVDDLVNSLGITPFRYVLWEGETTGGTIHLDGRYDSPPFKLTYTLANEWSAFNIRYTIQTTTRMEQSSAGNYNVPLEFPIITIKGEQYKFDVDYTFELGSEYGGTDYIELTIVPRKLTDQGWQTTTDIIVQKIEA